MATKLTKVIANFQTQLTAKLSVGGTSINIQSATDKNSVALPSGKYGFSINLGKADEEHIVADLVGTAISNIQSVSYQGVKTTGAAKEHRVGAVVKLTDFINFKVIVDLLSGADTFDSLTPLAYDAEFVITNRKQFAYAGYVQDVLSGAVGTASPTASGTTKVTKNQSAKPRAVSTLVREQDTPDMTLKVESFNHAEIEKNISFAGGNSNQFINPGFAGDLSISLNPSNNETFTLTINGTACVFTFVTSIGSTPGNVLIGGSAAITRANLVALVNAPGTTTANGVAFTGAQLTAMGLVNAVDDLSLNAFIKAISSTVTSFSATETMAGAGNVWTANTTKNRIDLLVVETSGQTIQIRRGTEAVSPVAPTPTSGDIVLASVYCKIGMTSVKDVTDGTNGYILSWYAPQVYRTDVILTSSTTAKIYPTLPAYESLVSSDLIKAINDSGNFKVKKIVGISSSITGSLTYAPGSQSFSFAMIATNKIVVAYFYSNALRFQVGTISGSTITFGSEAFIDSSNYTNSTYYSFKVMKGAADDTFVASYGYTNGSNSAFVYARAATVSGTTITFGSQVALYNEATSVRPTIYMTEIATGKFIVSFTRISGYLHDVCFTVSGNSITAGTSVIQMSASCSNQIVVKIADNVYVTFYNQTTGLYAVNTVSGTTISQGTARNISDNPILGFISGVKDSSDNAGFICYETTGATTTLVMKYFTRSSDTLTFTTAVSFTGYSALDNSNKANLILHNGFLYLLNSLGRVDKFAYNTAGNFVLLKTSASLLGGYFWIDMGVIEGGFIKGLKMTTSTTTANFINFLLDHDEFLAAVESSYSIGSSVPIKDDFNCFSGLVAGYDYYIKSDASGLTIDTTYQKVGKAISDTKILK